MKTSKELAQYYELGDNSTDYFNYIIDSYKEGDSERVIKLFSELGRDEQEMFLHSYLCECNKAQRGVKQICLDELNNNSELS